MAERRNVTARLGAWDSHEITKIVWIDMSRRIEAGLVAMWQGWPGTSGDATW